MVASEVGAGFHRVARSGDGVVIIDPRRRDQATLPQVEDGERRRAEIAADDDLIPRQRRSDVLQGELVLVGPEPRHLVVGLCDPAHRPSHGKALPLCGLEMLDPDRRLAQRTEDAGYVAGSEHVLSRWIPKLTYH